MSIDSLFDMESFFLALADKTRLRLLNLMRDDEVCVCFFTEALGESQPKISRHLAYLRNAGIVEARREGKWMNYRIIRPQNEYAAQVLQDTLIWLSSEETMRKDYEKLALACCAPDAPVTITRAPKPHNILLKADMNSMPKEEMETFLL
jgi:ArsR family transcriptional regulator